MEIDAIRAQEVRGRNFTFSRSFLIGEKSSVTWLQVLEETTNNVRIALRSLQNSKETMADLYLNKKL